MNDYQSNDNRASTLSANPESIQHFAIYSHQECYYLQSSDGRDFAIVNSRTTTALQRLQDLPSIRLEAVFVHGDTGRVDLKRKEGTEAAFSISIDLYGSEKVAQEVGKRLSKAHTYLQHPIFLKSNVPYNNPHYYAIPGVQTASIPSVSPSFKREEQEAPVANIAKVFEEVERTRKLLSQNADRHVRTPLLEYGFFSKSVMRD